MNNRPSIPMRELVLGNCCFFVGFFRVFFFFVAFSSSECSPVWSLSDRHECKKHFYISVKALVSLLTIVSATKRLKLQKAPKFCLFDFLVPSVIAKFIQSLVMFSNKF